MARVFLFRGNHPLYETLVSHPPEGTEYIERAKRRVEGSVQEYTLYNPQTAIARVIVDDTFRFLGTPRWFPVFRRYDLVHSCRGFFIVGPNPFVVDVEHSASFAGMHYDMLRSGRWRRLTEKALLSDKCRSLLPHCEAAEKTLSLVSRSPVVQGKTTVLYPTIVPQTRAARLRERDCPCLLFMGEYYWKGGREFIEACIRLKDKLDFKIKYISLRVHPPEQILRRAKEKLEIDYIEGPVHRAELISTIYSSADIFVMPTYIDTFGYAFLEAMSFGLPCVGTRHFAVPEIVQDGATGIVVDPLVSYFDDRGLGHPDMRVEDAKNEKAVEALKGALDRLVSSSTLRDSMGRAGFDSVSEGRFSVKRRNGILKSVYESAIRA